MQGARGSIPLTSTINIGKSCSLLEQPPPHRRVTPSKVPPPGAPGSIAPDAVPDALDRQRLMGCRGPPASADGFG